MTLKSLGMALLSVTMIAQPEPRRVGAQMVAMLLALLAGRQHQFLSAPFAKSSVQVQMILSTMPQLSSCANALAASARLK